jgi:hypothetical protein
MAKIAIKRIFNNVVFFTLSNKPDLICSINESDYSLLQKNGWYIYSKKNTCSYIRRNIVNNKNQYHEHLHREVLRAGDYRVENPVDHKNINGLDNRKENLREVTPLENVLNRNNSTGLRYKNCTIVLNKKTKSYQSYLYVKGDRIYIGSSKDLKELHEKIDSFVKNRNENIGP